MVAASTVRQWCVRYWHAFLVAALMVLVAIPVARTATPVHAGTSGYTPAQIAQAYDVTPLAQRGVRGQRQTIAFIEVDGIDLNDLAYFDRAFGLPSARPDIYVPRGTTQALPPGPETTLDIEWAHALAPAAGLQIYEVTQVGDFQNYSGQLAAMVEAALGNGATDISMSLRGTGSILCSTLFAAVHLHGAFQDAVAKGVTVFAASGDYAYHPCQSSRRIGTVYPASDPDVTAVGGTALSLARGGGYGGETTWSGSGGGYSIDFRRPSYQRGPGAFDARYRSVPDVAFDAAETTGVAVRFNGQWVTVGGTSVGAPCWAALWALAEQYHEARTGKPLGWANPLLYGLANSPQRNRVYHDITTGNDGHWQAGPGWDRVTGWGSPDAAALVTALGAR